MTGEVWDQIHDLWFTRIVVLPLGDGGGGGGSFCVLHGIV